MYRPQTPYTEARKLEIIRLLYHKLKEKELGPNAAIWIHGNLSIYFRREIFDEPEYLKWPDAEQLSQRSATQTASVPGVPVGKPVGKVAFISKLRKRA